ncbi:MAG: hypothetical protein WBH01_06800 [Dehalococcoidia bacterium]
MAVVLNDQTYYRTADVCRMVGISRNILFRSLKEGMVTDVEYRDWRGWRLLTLAQVEITGIKTNNITAIRQNN